MAENTQTQENQAVETSRDRLLNRYREKYKDDDFSSEGQLESRILEDLDVFDAERARYDKLKEATDKMTDLFASDARSAALLNAWASGEDPIKFMLENFGDDFKAALESPEGQQAFLESHNKWLEKRAKDKELATQRDENFNKSMQVLEDWRTKNNLTEEQAVEVFMKIHQTGADVVDGIYTEDAFDMARKAMNYDNDINSAKVEGQIEGRNERIREMLREDARSASNPPTLGGQGAPAPESQTKGKRRDPWGIIS